MTQTVELLLDPASEERVLAEWQALDRAGLPSQARHRGESNRPHVTLSASEAIPAEAEQPLARVPADALVAPGRWTPHVTLARRMPPEQLPAALEVLVPRGATGAVRFTGARRWDSAARRTWTLALQ